MKTATAHTNKAGSLAELAKSFFPDWNNLLVPVMSFLMGNNCVAGGNLPLGAVFFAALRTTTGAKIPAVLAAVAGTLAGGSLPEIYAGLSCMLIFRVLCIPLGDAEAKAPFKPAAALLASVFVPRFLLAAMQGFLLYDMLNAFFISFISCIIFFVFRISVPIIAGYNKKTSLHGEEAACLAVTAALALSGAGMLNVWGFSLQSVFCVLLLMFFGYKYGAGAGAAAGAAAGLIAGAGSGFTASASGTYAICGMLAGVTRNLGKPGTVSGFILGNMVLALYFNGTSEAVLYLRETIAAAILFFLFPGKLMTALPAAMFAGGRAPTGGGNAHMNRVRDIIVEKLEKFSAAFLSLSRACGGICETPESTAGRDINNLLDRVADRICRNCGLCPHCWERNFYDTYRVMLLMMERLEQKGRIDECDLPGSFLEKCPRASEFARAVNNIYEVFREGIVLRSRLGEVTAAMRRQYEGLSRLVSELADEVGSGIKFLGNLEADILVALRNAGIRAVEAAVRENARGRYEICVVREACGKKGNCSETIEKVVSEAAGRRMECAGGECRGAGNGTCYLKFAESGRFKLATGVARLAKSGNDVSGDSFGFVDAGDGKFLLALSDGTGSGRNAEINSRMTIGVLESLIESGFDKDVAASLVRSLLALKSDEDGSCTVDAAIVDMSSGEAEFVKIGAAPTYIKRGGEIKNNGVIEIVKSASLPAGILPDMDVELPGKMVGDGDMIIMVTDGIIECMDGEEPGDRMLAKFIQHIGSLNPQQVADLIMEEASTRCGGKPNDDMTILVAKVWEKIS